MRKQTKINFNNIDVTDVLSIKTILILDKYNFLLKKKFTS